MKQGSSVLFILMFLAYCKPLFVRAQDSSFSYYDFHPKGLHRRTGPHFAQTEKTIGLVAEANFLSRYALGAGIAYGSFEFGEGFIGGRGITLGVDYVPQQKITAPYAEAWVSANAFLIIGLFLGVRGTYYTNSSTGKFALRPEIGYGLGKFNLYYGRNIFFDNEFIDISRNTLTLSAYFSVYPFH